MINGGEPESETLDGAPAIATCVEAEILDDGKVNGDDRGTRRDGMANEIVDLRQIAEAMKGDANRRLAVLVGQ